MADSANPNDLRPAIVAEIMKLVQPDRIKLDPRPSIAELEKLRDDGNADLRVEPNGDVTIRDLRPRTVHDVANAVMGIVDPAMARETITVIIGQHTLDLLADGKSVELDLGVTLIPADDFPKREAIGHGE